MRWSWSGQREGDKRVAQGLFCDFRMAASGDHHVLFAVRAELVGHRCGVATSWKLRLPQLLACFHIEGTKVGIEGAGDENQSSRTGDGATQADRSWWDRRLLTAKILQRTEGNLPSNLSFRHVNRDEHTPGWRRARQLRRRLEEAAKQSVGRPGLRGILAVFRADFVAPEISAGNELYFGNQVVRVHEQKAVLRIKGVATPGHASKIARHSQSALNTWRSEDTLVAKRANPGPAGLAILGSRSPGILRRDLLRSEWRRSCGEGLRG